jgi:CDP-glycerol glycerophosphotransferase (TagB/SpsB family)
MLCRMYDAVPDDLKDRVVILPHPLITDLFKEEKDGIGSHILMADSYDKVFRDCGLLITDYSSIAYDAFYRGANVVFDWQDLDECMEHYGEGTHLMLNDGNVFGRACRTPEELKKAVAESYGKPQREEDIERYRKIVEFHDGKNSERIIEKLIEDGMIERK